MRHIILIVVVLGLGSARLAGQESARERARRTLDPDVFGELSALVEDFATSGVPEEPLYTKALEGTAKRVPPSLLVPAVRDYGTRLGEARLALGPSASMSLIVAGADALQRGVPRETLGALPTDRTRSPMAVLALTELLESGVPTDRALEVLREVAALRADDGRELDVAARIRRLIRQGVAPRDAVERIRRAMLSDRATRIGPAVPPGSEPPTSDRPRDR
jgi:hypothetical protein